MQVACPICWHSVVTLVVCRNCGLVQCLEYEGPKCISCGGVCKVKIRPPVEEIADGHEEEESSAVAPAQA